ncbi:sensor histidine kinase [Actinomadura rupiterrae]|uniref:sensor histidine kinase n=1 Tax=Actinomadura rupiterrae TaxID=559627 RepID=UPI0020A264D6|nr:sensor histidine kinase [Actinomadura rupiterrae]MCP2340235.1 signal transduction histidine kinase [Actinomadura rupiterrae]
MSGEVALRDCFRRHAAVPWRGLRLWLLSFPLLFVSTMVTTAFSLVGVGVGILLVPSAVLALRSLLGTYRDLVSNWTGRTVERPYLPVPEGGPTQRFVAIIQDPATWRDLAFMLLDPFVSAFTASLSFFAMLYGIYGWLLAAFLGRIIKAHSGNEWYTFIPLQGSFSDHPVNAALIAGFGTLYAIAGLYYGPRLMDVYGRWTQSMLGPTEKSRLALRVQHLAETRADAVDTSARELRRIERDLHDGAQARLVAMGMSLGAIEHLLDKDPDRARTLLAETRASSAKALSELRDLVRGIHPPVLADRGVGDAVKALALDHPLPVEVSVDLPGRPDAPVESAAYFAVSEILTNVAKHSGARHVWVDVRYEAGMLRISVTDDGTGGASMSGGTGLRGIERRIGTFDGVLALSSPPGGPTIVTLELPCALLTS